MRKKDTRPQFQDRYARREGKVKALQAEGTSDSRKQLKSMHTIVMGKTTRHNTVGAWKTTRGRVKCSVKNKTRHTTSAAKRIMRGLT